MKTGRFAFAALGLVVGWLSAVMFHRDRAASGAGEAQCPMHPWIRSAQGGQCTLCGMDLVPATNNSEVSEDIKEVMLPPASVKAIGVETAVIKRALLVRTQRYAGRFEEDATAHAIISAPVEGRIDGLGLVHGNGKVTQRQPLANIFSHTLLTEAREYKDALNHDEAAVTTARQKLERHGLVWEQIKSIPLRQDNDLYFGILSPRTGTVVKSYVSEGQYVRDGERLFEITDLTKLWFMFSVFEQDLPLLEPGQSVEIETASVPPETIKARITSMGKDVDEATRSVDVRVEVANPKGSLRLNGAGVCVAAFRMPEVLSVSRSAVLWPGVSPRVYVEMQPGRYEPREVQLGRAGDHDWEVLAGLKEGERVVTEAAMLMDGQSQLRGSR